MVQPNNQATLSNPNGGVEVLNAAPCSFYAIEYIDVDGTKRQTVCMLMGDQTYYPPNHIQWTKDLRQTPRAVRDAVLNVHKPVVPLNGAPLKVSTDGVDVL